MADEANELGKARADYKAAFGKQPGPRLSAEQIRAKIAEHEAAKAAGSGDANTQPPADPAATGNGAAKAPKAAKAPNAAEGDELPPHGTALLDHADEGASASYDGVEIRRGRNKLFLVPLAAVEPLLAHGFALVRGGE